MALDISSLIAVVGDDEATIQHFLHHFLRNAEQDIATILDGHNKHSCGDVAIASHRLKSSARTVGADELGDLCYKLEKAGKDEDWHSVDANINSLTPLFTDVKEYINTHYSE